METIAAGETSGLDLTTDPQNSPTFLPGPRRERGHIPGLDGLRGIAILAVMLHHFKTYGSGSG
jgi:hypothetical protein